VTDRHKQGRRTVRFGKAHGWQFQGMAVYRIALGKGGNKCKVPRVTAESLPTSLETEYKGYKRRPSVKKCDCQC